MVPVCVPAQGASSSRGRNAVSMPHADWRKVVHNLDTALPLFCFPASGSYGASLSRKKRKKPQDFRPRYLASWPGSGAPNHSGQLARALNQFLLFSYFLFWFCLIFWIDLEKEGFQECSLSLFLSLSLILFFSIRWNGNTKKEKNKKKRKKRKKQKT